MPSDSVSHHSSRNDYSSSNDSIKPVTITPKESIENALKNLALGEQIFIDTEGGIHTSKEPFLRSDRAPLVTFTATSNGFIVNSGVHPRNRTYVGREQDISLQACPLRYSAMVSSGTFVGLTELCSFEVPSSKEGLPDPTKEVLSGTEGLQAVLAYAEKGDTVVLGRSAVKSGTLLGTVSRQHLTAFVVDKTDNGDGTFVLYLRLKLGIPTEASVEVDLGNGYAPVHGERLANGGKVRAGALAEIRIPHPLGSVEERSFDSMRSFVEYGSLLNEPGLDEMPDMPQLVVAAYLSQGLEFIRDGAYADAYQLFLDGAGVLENAGYQLHISSIHQGISLINGTAAQAIEEIAKHSRCDTEGKRVELVTARSPETEEMNVEQKNTLRVYHRNASLIYARVYGCLLQELRGEAISKSAVLIEGLSSEADIGAYFFEHRIVLPNSFIERYPDILKAIEILQGYQTEEEQRAFTATLNRCPFGELVTIGANLFSDEIGGEERREVLNSLREREAVIRRNTDGTYTLFAIFEEADNAIFVADSKGLYGKLDPVGAVNLEPGAILYLGKGFRLELP